MLADILNPIILQAFKNISVSALIFLTLERLYEETASAGLIYDYSLRYIKA